MDAQDWEASMRQARIQDALDYRRGRPSVSCPLSSALSAEEADELEGRAGDTGSVESSHSGTFGPQGGDFQIGEFWTSPAVFPNTIGGPAAKPPLGVNVLQVESAPETPQSVELEESEHLPDSLKHLSVLSYLATFGIIGVVVRYLLDVLFGPGLAGLTSNSSALFNNLPANMFGSFFMGWVGVVFKRDITMFSEHLAVGLSTGLMGSITTYAGMMQRNLAVMVMENWLTGLFGLLVGLYLSLMSLVVGEDSARLLLRVVSKERERKAFETCFSPSADNLKRRKVGLAIFLFLGVGMWTTSLVLAMLDTASVSRRTLWLACCVSPPGVWMRWFVARLNGQGIGHNHFMRWFPLGTFVANVLASSLEATLTTLNSAVGTSSANLVIGAITMGTLGCLSTVSAFVAEIQIMHEGSNRWRAYAYPIFSMTVSLFIGLLVYALPALVEIVPVVPP